ncbi:hypothetical protein OEZ85_009134 [Tetradesmus obliquus]|uniref:Oligosaccharyltransferase complex subunit n=1 Tax=Tetradesmus obliquus TaxID=3088 RepID=A0ABY8TN48_TETOB|nr:hypothetical protein OEZ85_009134 [Tetradesmus obliquus]
MPGLIETIVTKVEEFELPKASTVCSLVILSYFLVTAGIAYDIINEPPAVGAVQDEVTGKVKPVTFMPHRMNGQYIIEGISGAMMYTLGGLSLIALDQCQSKRTDYKLRIILVSLGGFGLVMAYSAVMTFLNIKMPGYMRY